MALTGTTAYIADWPTGELAAASTLSATIYNRLSLDRRIYGVTAEGRPGVRRRPGRRGQPCVRVLVAAPPNTPMLVASLTVPGEAMQML